MKKNRTLVLGIGNLVLRDEGVGIQTIYKLEKEKLPPHVDLLDGGTGGVAMIGTLQEYGRIIMIDAALDSSVPYGTVKVIKPRFSSDYPILLSSHEFGLRDMIEAMMIQDNIPPIDLITIAVKDYQRIGMDLSPEVEGAIPEVIEKVKTLLN